MFIAIAPKYTINMRGRIYLTIHLITLSIQSQGVLTASICHKVYLHHFIDMIIKQIINHFQRTGQL